MSVMVATRTAVLLEASCCESELPQRFLTQLGVPKYATGASIMPVPDSLQEWREEHRTARKRADRCARLGYTFRRIHRGDHSDDINEINASLPERQGRPMTDGYTTPREHQSLPDYPCDRHRIDSYGVLSGRRLVAYLTLYRVGELALVSMILGHGDHLRDDIMYLLAARVIEDQAGQGGFFYYNRHDSGTDGLRYYKERLGFGAADLEFVL